MARLEQRWKRREKARQGDLYELVHEVGESHLVNTLGVRFELVRLMDHPDPLVRHNALGALAYHGVFVDWGDEFGKRLLKSMNTMLREDDDSDCRRQAAAAFGSLFSNSHNREVIRQLGLVCANSLEENDVRAFAYVSLLRVVSLPVREQPNPFGLRVGANELEHVRRLVESG